MRIELLRTKFIAGMGSMSTRIFMIILTGLILVGCVINKEEQVLVQESKQQDVESVTSEKETTQKQHQQLLAWREGIATFERGQYQKAQDTFKSLTQMGGDEDLRRKALYALACTRLIMANDPQSYLQALAVWESWEKAVPSEMPHEDPRMVTPLLKRIPQPLNNQQEEVELLKHKIEVLEEVHRTIDFAIWEYWRESAPTDVLLEDPLMVTPRLQNISQLLQRQQDEIQRLRHQIEALEEIDRTIEEKKKEATSD